MHPAWMSLYDALDCGDPIQMTTALPICLVLTCLVSVCLVLLPFKAITGTD
mgnify:CR=1 FL=1